MGIRITQICDGSLGEGVDCEETREIELPKDRTSYTLDYLTTVASRGGWREVFGGKWLCLGCIKRALGE